MAEYDLQVLSITGSPNSVGIGQALTYEVVVRNNSGDTADNVELQETFSTKIYFSSIKVTQGSYCYVNDTDTQNRTITWKVGTLKTGDEGKMTVVVIPLEAPKIVTDANVYSTNSGDTDSNPSNNHKSLEITVIPSVDLAIFKENCPAEATIGEPFTYLISVINNGPATANNVTVTDELPEGMDFLSASSSPQGNCQVTGNTISCTLTSLDVNDRWRIRIDVTPSKQGTVVNTAEVASDEPDLNQENNTDSLTTTVSSAIAADISISKTANPEEVLVDNTLVYNLQVKNNGPSTATNVTLVDTLPENVTIGPITPSQGDCMELEGVITCNLGDLASGAAASVEIQIKPSDSGLIVNSATVSACEDDPNLCNNAASVCTYVKRALETDLSIVKSHSQEPAVISTPVIYTIKITNNGPNNATGIILSDQIPPSLEILSLTSTQGRCCICDNKGCHNHYDYCYFEEEHNGCNGKDIDEKSLCKGSREVICQIGSLAKDASATVKLCVRPKLLGSITNRAIVTSNEEDLDLTNNEAEDTLTVITLQEKIELLINWVYVNLGPVEKRYVNLFLEDLKDAKTALCSNEPCKAEQKLSSFISKVKKYIRKGATPQDQWCNFERAIRLIKKQLECSCNGVSCKETKCRDCWGDDPNE